MPGQGTHDVVFAVTEHNTVYAYDADNPTQSTPLWRVNLGPSVPISVLNISDDIINEVGVTSTPVIDLTTNTIYIVAQNYENNAVKFKLNALDITTGAHKTGSPVVIQGSVPGTASDSVAGVLTFNPRQNLQRPGLLLFDGRVYIGFGSHNDLEPYHGWVFGYDGTSLQRTAVQCLSPDAQGAGVWQGGVGLAADSAGNIYVQTGHTAALGPGISYSNSLVKLSTANNLAIVDYFSPANKAALDQTNSDYGASGPILIPGTSLILGGGKDGRIYVNDTSNLGQFHTVNHVVQEFQATFSALQGIGGLFARNVFYNSTLYVWGMFDKAKAYAFNGSMFNTTPVSQSAAPVPNGYSNEPGMAISADGTTPGTGILWAAYSSSGGSNGGAFPGVLSALDASDLSRELWNSNQNRARDDSGSWAKWSPPTVANGKVYLASFDNVLNVFGLISVGAPASVTATAGTPQSSVVNSGFATALQATVLDTNQVPVPNVSVTFTAPGSGASASFASGATTTATTDGNGVATAPTLTANGSSGSYSVAATVAGVATGASFALTNVPVGANGTLTGTVTTATTAVTVSTEGTLDWVHWGDATLTRKAGVSAQLSTYTRVGTGTVANYADDLRTMAWTGGTPTGSGSEQPAGGVHLGGRERVQRYGAGRHDDAAAGGARRRVSERRAADGAAVGWVGGELRRPGGDVDRHGEQLRPELHADLPGRGQRPDPDGQLGDDLGVEQCESERRRAVGGGRAGEHRGDGGHAAERGGQHGVWDGAAGDGAGWRRRRRAECECDVHGASDRGQCAVCERRDDNGDDGRQWGGDGADADGEWEFGELQRRGDGRGRGDAGEVQR